MCLVLISNHLFYFARQVNTKGLKARDQFENDLNPFKDVTYPMDMSAEQKCFDLGGGCKVKELFCVKCACKSSDVMFSGRGWSVSTSALMNGVLVNIDAIILKLMIQNR